MSTYIIGEIGQNHNGSVDLAKAIIDLISRPPIDELFGTELQPINAVKLTKRDLEEELTKSAMNKPYDSINSFGRTYGEHRAFLELSFEEHYEIYLHAKSKNLDVIETLCSIKTLDILNHFTPDQLKVASRDLTNLPLLDAMAKTQIPMILSTGMAGQRELDQAISTICKHHSNLSILHCLSQYPAEHRRLNLRTISFLIENYPEFTIGYSDHSIGIMIPTAAIALGAKIIEKHVTIDRFMKGTDQKGSLGPDGVRRMVRDIRILEQSLGEEEIFLDDAAEAARIKLERSLATNKSLSKGHRINESDLCLLSPGDGVKWSESNLLIGKTLKKDIKKSEIIYLTDIE